MHTQMALINRGAFILAHMLEDKFSIDISHIFIVLQRQTAQK